ncbi:hypothetical protein [Alteromonas halophila]|uniref:Uncharacterized protein n=1 Tax=Alteromonas halophila TaxID=516698 RepID=A0A918MYZ6_9ALTE|nr:hypothetical protein [Alteromonas halophila]GGW83422.1 hypothetical protein GCM10007391_16120 [Alteromonas halophila]
MIISNQTSLLDYLNNPESAQNTLSELANSPGKAQLAQETKALTEPASEAGIQDMLEKIEAGDSSVSLTTIGNMLEHYKSKVSADLQDIAANLNAPVAFERQDDRWVVTQPEGQREDKTLSRMQQYLDKDTRLTQRLSQINQLAEMHELGQAREHANTLKAQGVEDDAIVDFLSNARQQIFAEDSLTFTGNTLTANAEQTAQTLFDAISTSS